MSGGCHSKPLYALIAIYCVLLAIRGVVWEGSGVDELYYYGQLTSPIFDGDLNLDNDILESRNNWEFNLLLARQIYDSGTIGVPFAIGMPYLNAPLFFLARLIDTFTGGAFPELADRYSYFYRMLATFTTWTFVLAGLIALQRIASRFTSEWLAVALTYVVFLGTNACYYTWNAPMMTHGVSFGVGAIVLLFTIRYREAPSIRKATLLGFLTGLAFLVRWQEVLWAIPSLIIVVEQALKIKSAGQIARHLACFCGAFFIMCLPQLIVWYQIYGQIILIPQGNNFIRFEITRLVLILFSPINGWIYSHPLILLMMLSFVFAFKFNWRLSAAALTLLLFMIITNMLPSDWWAGGSFGARRFTGVTPILMLPLAMMTGSFGKVKQSALLLVCGLLVFLNLSTVFFYSAYPFEMLNWSGLFRIMPSMFEQFTNPNLLFSSDLFISPNAVYNRLTLWLLYILLFNVFFLGYFLVSMHNQVAPAVKSTFFYGLTISCLSFGSILMATPIKEKQTIWKWYNASSFERVNPHDVFSVMHLEELKSLLDRSDFERANELTTRLSTLIPKAALGAWLKSPRDSPFREKWIEQLSTQEYLSEDALHQLFQEESHKFNNDSMQLIAKRMKDKPGRVAFHRFEHFVESGAGTSELTWALEESLQENPWSLSANLEWLRLHRNRKDAKTKFDKIENLSMYKLENAEYVNHWHSDLYVAFRDSWHGTFINYLESMQFLGLIKHQEKLLETVKPIRADGGLTEYLSNVYQDNWKFEQNLALNNETFSWEEKLVINPVELRISDGWGRAEPDGARWSRHKRVFIPIQLSLPPGVYQIDLHCYSFPGKKFRQVLRMEFYGESSPVFVESQGGTELISVKLELEKDSPRPILSIHHPIFPIKAAHPGSMDGRWVGIRLSKAVLRKR